MTEERELGTLLYPNLPESVARTILAERKDLDLQDLRLLGALSHAEASPLATGGTPAGRDSIASVQRAVWHAAEEAGYPSSPDNSQRQLFDRLCASGLYDVMNIVPADAANEGVWAFLTVVVLPEITPWRFTDTAAEERYLGKPRNTLRRLWWRAWAFGTDFAVTPEGCTPLGEDEYVQIMERTTLGGNRNTARALREALWRAEATGRPFPRSPLMRFMALRLRAARSHICLDALTQGQLVSLLDEITEQAFHDLEVAGA